MKIKICGLFREEDIDYVNEGLPDYIGFIFVPGRHRTVSMEKAQVLKNKLDPRIKAIGVFIDEDISKIQELCNNKVIDGVQLHGHEDHTYISKLKEVVNVPVIKAIRLEEGTFTSYNVDYYLFDGINPGTGQVFDWKLLPQVDHPFFLAGGISIDNIKEALQTHAYALDLSSSVETNGIKDRDKILEVIRRVRDE